MEAYKYQIEVTTDVIHGWKTTINEVYIPQISACFNEAGGVFYSAAPRSDVNSEKIKVSNKAVVAIEALLECSKPMANILKETFGQDGIRSVQGQSWQVEISIESR